MAEILCSKTFIQKRKQTVKITDLCHYLYPCQKYLKYQRLVYSNILIDEQYGFRINSSTVKATHKLLNTILNALNKRK